MAETKQSKTTKMSKTKRKKKTIKPQISHLYRPGSVDLVTWQIKLRKQMAKTEMLSVSDREPGVYDVHNPKSGEEYKVVYRGARSPWNYCSCMDFKTSRLGTCKHLEAVKGSFGGKRRVCRDVPAYTSVYVDYRSTPTVRIRIGNDDKEAFEALASRYFTNDYAWKSPDFRGFDSFLKAARAISDTFRCYPDALNLALECRDRKVRTQWVNAMTHEDFVTLLNAELYLYQEEGIRFAAKAGRAIIADEMGLGKTIQAIGTAQLLRRFGLVETVLILCPTTLKYQWKREIERFTNERVHVIEGDHLSRRNQYRGEEPYRIISYHAATNDIKVLGQLETDMLIIDEVQRLKNWDTRIARAARKIKSRYAVILSGTPLENKLEELYSVMELVDQFCLSPYYLFRDRYIDTDERGVNVGYKNLNELGERLKPILIRRRKCDVKLQMPKRQDKNLMVPMTNEQQALHEEAAMTVSMLMRKWERFHFLSETDRNRLMMALQKMRMVCDSTFVLDQKTRYDTKVAEIVNIISDLIESGDEKVVVFSQWERMARIIAQELQAREIRFEFLHGGVPSVKRKDMVNDFTDDPSDRVFLSTDAGCTGLNLQAASLIINVDLPWNPAVLEQRIARIYRLGQQRSIQVINLVAANTFEEQMLGKLKFKSALFEGVLDGGMDTLFAGDSKFKKMMDDLSNTMSSAFEAPDEQPISVSDDEQQVAANPESLQDMAEEAAMVADNPGDQETEAQAPQHSMASSEEPAEKTKAGNSPAGDGSGTSSSAGTSSSSGTSPTASASSSPDASPSSGTSSGTHRSSGDLVQQGISFFQGLAETLKSPEATQRLVDDIVEVNHETGETNIKIPVASKDAVASIFTLMAKLIGGK